LKFQWESKQIQQNNYKSHNSSFD